MTIWYLDKDIKWFFITAWVFLLQLKVKLTLGFVKQKDDKNVSQDYGAMLYARNRLIVAYYKVRDEIYKVYYYSV